MVLGPRASLAICAALLAACLALSAHAALAGRGLTWAWATRPAWEPALRAAGLAVSSATLAPSVAAGAAVLRSGFGREEVSHAITVAVRTAGLGTLVLAMLV